MDCVFAALGGSMKPLWTHVESRNDRRNTKKVPQKAGETAFGPTHMNGLNRGLEDERNQL